MSLGFTASAPLPICADQQVIDGDGDGNGLLDPGETVDLVLTLRNFGSAASDVAVTIQTDDNFVDVEDGSASFGNIAAGAVGTNATDPFRIRAPVLARHGHIVEFTAVASYAGGQTQSHFMLCLGKFNFLVWDPTGEQSSGPVILRDPGVASAIGAAIASPSSTPTSVSTGRSSSRSASTPTPIRSPTMPPRRPPLSTT